MEKHKDNLRPPPRFAWSDLDRRPDEARGGPPLGDADLASLIRQIERRRHRWQVGRRDDLAFFGKITLISLRMEGLDTSEADIVEAMLNGGVRGDLRSRRAQLVRNHVAIQLRIERAIGNGLPLKPSAVLGWYASLCSGRPATGIDAAGMARIEQVCRQIHSPPMQLQAAIADIAGLHSRLLQDPLVPSFNGILVRLLLRYHLGRCGLPQIVLGSDDNSFERLDPRRLYNRLVTLLHQRLVEIGRERNG